MFLMNTIVFFVLINCATILETHIQWHKVCITKMLIATEKNVTTLKFLWTTTRMFEKSVNKKLFKFDDQFLRC